MGINIKKKHSFKIKIALVVFLIVIFALGYKIPWFDKHPEWGEFPLHTNQRVIIQEITDFKFKYKNKFFIPKARTALDEYTFFDYQTNLKNIQSIDFRVTDNEFRRGSALRFRSGFSNTGVSSHGQTNQSYPTTFLNLGYEYFALEVGGQKTHFKLSDAEKSTTFLVHFYQYNIPKSPKDTLFFNYFGTAYKAYVKN